MLSIHTTATSKVAPVRERGLKSVRFHLLYQRLGRSREGAWIEIKLQTSQPLCMKWVAPARERGLKLRHYSKHGTDETVAPARERGLKLLNLS